MEATIYGRLEKYMTSCVNSMSRATREPFPIATGRLTMSMFTSRAKVGCYHGWSGRVMALAQSLERSRRIHFSTYLSLIRHLDMRCKLIPCSPELVVHPTPAVDFSYIGIFARRHHCNSKFIRGDALPERRKSVYLEYEL